MRLSKEQAVELVKQDPTYISGLTEEQKRMPVLGNGAAKLLS